MPIHIKNTKQSGFAAILLVLVTGLAAAAIVFAQVAYVQGAQQTTQMLKNTTPTQAKAWLAADAIRIALGDAPNDYITSLVAGQSIPVEFSNSSDYAFTAVVLKNTVVSDGNELTLRVVAKENNGGSNVPSSAVLAVTYLITAKPCVPDVNCPKPLTPYTIVVRGDLKNTGVLRFLGEGGSAFVDGNVILSGTSEAFDRLCATGDIEIGSDIHIQNVCADGNLQLKDSASVRSAQIRGAVTMQSSSSINTLINNGDVIVSNGTVHTLKTKGNLQVVQTGKVGTTQAEGDVDWTSSMSASEIRNNGAIKNYTGTDDQGKLFTLGAATLSGNVAELNAVGDINLTTTKVGDGVNSVMSTNGNFRYVQGRTFVKSGSAGGSISPTIDKSVLPPVNVNKATVFPVVNIPRVNVPTVKPVPVDIIGIDSSYLRDSSNYAFTLDDQNRITVRVHSVTGIEDGQYFLGAYPATGSQELGRDYLCKQVTSGTINGKSGSICQLPANKDLARTICNTIVVGSPCFTYDLSARSWVVNTSSPVSGSMWFDGDVRIESGNYANAFIATGNISLAGTVTLKAMNFAGFDEVCRPRIVKGKPSPLTSGIYPANICDFGKSVLQTPLDPVGNAILIAGTYSGSTFTGGNINFLKSNEVFGTVLAGNTVNIGDASNTGQTVTIHGRLVAAGQRDAGALNQFNGIINFVIDDFPATFDAALTPCMSSGCQIGGAQTSINSISQTSNSNGTSVIGPGTPLATTSVMQAASSTNGSTSSSTPSNASSECKVGCTAGSVSQVRVYWASYE